MRFEKYFQDVESAKCAVQNDLKILFQSQFADISVNDSGDFGVWSKSFLSAIEQKLQDASAVSKSDVETLEKQANHYKTILAETVSVQSCHIMDHINYEMYQKV